MMLLVNSSKYIMPLLLVFFSLVLLLSGKRNVTDSFISGARDGAVCCFNLLPTLILVSCGVSCLFSSGAIDLAGYIFKPLLSFFELPAEMLPAIILRPFSGSAVTAVADRIFSETGADSTVSKTAYILMGTTDTIIYTLSVYFSAVNIKRTRYALPASFIVYVFSVILCVFVGRNLL